MELSASTIRGWQRQLMDSTLPGERSAEADAERVEILRALEDLKATGAAVQAGTAVGFSASQRAQQAAAGEPAERQGRGVASQVGLARRESPNRGQQLLGMAKDLLTEMPNTYARLLAGDLSEYRAQLIVTATSGLDPDKRAQVDAALCADPRTLAGAGNKKIRGLATRAAQKIDPMAAVRRNRRAVGDRRVSARPAPDGMMYLSGLVEMVPGVGAYATLKRDADSIVATGDADGRTHAQVMADLLLQRITGQDVASDTPVAVDLILADTTLLGGGTEPAVVPGFGDVPAEIARHLVAHAVDIDAAWFRKLYANVQGHLVAMSTKQRLTTPGLSTFLRLRDQGICRTPWCDAPIRHDDHVRTHAEGGETSAENMQGLCAACDYAKQAPGWRQRASVDVFSGRHRVDITTPTDHHYYSLAPAPPVPARVPQPGVESVGEAYFRLVLAA